MSMSVQFHRERVRKEVCRIQGGTDAHDSGWNYQELNNNNNKNRCNKTFKWGFWEHITKKTIEGNCNFYFTILTFFSQLQVYTSQLWLFLGTVRYKLAVASYKVSIAWYKLATARKLRDSQFWESLNRKIQTILRNKVAIQNKKSELADINSQYDFLSELQVYI